MKFIILKEDKDRKKMSETIVYENLAYFKPNIAGKLTIFDSVEDAEAIVEASKIKWPGLKFEIIEKELSEEEILEAE